VLHKYCIIIIIIFITAQHYTEHILSHVMEETELHINGNKALLC